MLQVKKNGVLTHTVTQQFSHERDSMWDDSLSFTGFYMGFWEALKGNTSEGSGMGIMEIISLIHEQL